MFLNHTCKQNFRSCSYLMLSFAFDLAQLNIHFILYCPKLSFYLFHCCLQLILQFVYQGLTPTSIYGCLKGVMMVHLLATPHHPLNTLGTSLQPSSVSPGFFWQYLTAAQQVGCSLKKHSLHKDWSDVYGHTLTQQCFTGATSSTELKPVCWLKEYHITGLYPVFWCCNSQL